jgi:hypothetical protein
MAQGNKWDPETMKAAIEAVRNKEMGSYKASRVFSVPQTTLERCIKGRDKSSNETIKTKLGRKQVPPCEAENYLAEHCLWMDRQFVGLTIADVMRLAYQLAVGNRVKNKFCRRNEKTVRKWLKISYVVIQTFQFEPLKVFHSQGRGVSLLNQ